MIYKRIEDNKRKSLFLILFFILLVVLLAYVFNYLISYGPIGIIFAFVLALISALSGYYHGDKLILTMSRARPVTKKDNPFLVNTVEALALGAGIPTPKIYVLPDNSINAFATGRDPKHSSIAITQGALKKLSRQEIEGVLGHEISHIKNYDIRLMTITTVLVGIVALLSDFAIRSFWWGGYRRRDDEGSLSIIILILGLLFIALAPIIAKLIQLAISRKREFLADADSALLTHNPQGLINALKKIAKDKTPTRTANTATAHLYFSNPLPKKAFYKLFMTHPPIEERIKALQEL